MTNVVGNFKVTQHKRIARRTRVITSKRIVGLIAVLGVAAVCARAADSLELKNGSLIKGKFMGGSQTSVSFQVGSSVQSYGVADIHSLRFDSDARRDRQSPRISAGG
jgi:hypothetical protein